MKKLRYLLFLFVFSVSFSKEEINIGIIYEKSSKDENSKIINEEIKNNFKGTDYEPIIAKEIEYSNEDEFDRSYKKLDDNNKVDVIMAMGYIGAESLISNKETVSKLTVAPFGVGVSEESIKNLNYISQEVDVLKDINFYNQLRKINKIGLLIPNSFETKLLKKRLDDVVSKIESQGYSVEILTPTSNNIEEKLKKIDLLYITELDYNDSKKIIENANNLKVPTFARLSEEGYKDNVLLSRNSSKENRRRIRAGVASLVRALNNTNQKDVLTKLRSLDTEINFNMEVAKDINVLPNIRFAQKVNLINIKDSSLKTLSLKDGITEALNNNPTVKNREQSITTDEYGVKMAGSRRKPHLEAFTEFNKLDSDSASEAGTPAENTLKGGISLNYLLFDDEVNANISVRDFKRQATIERYNQENLDIIRDFSTTYLKILDLYEKLNVEKYNYDLMKDFLQIARTKYEVGQRSKKDIFRFESEIADSLTKIAEIKGTIDIEESNLNEILNRSMNESYSLKGVKETSLPFKDITSILDLSSGNSSEIKKYFIEKGLKNSPEIKQINYYIKAKERQIKSAKRERYLPKVNAFGEWGGNLKKDWGNGSDDTSEKDDWNLGARVSLPLYEGGNIEYRKQNFISELKELKFKKKSLSNNVSKKVSSSFAEVIKNFIQIETTKESAKAALDNLDLVSDLYAKGNISITELLDARTNYLSADRLKISAQYDYLKSLVNLERSSGQYIMMMDDIDRDNEIDKLKNYVEEGEK